MKNDEKALKVLTDEELMALEGGFSFKDFVKPVINVRPPMIALYAIFPIWRSVKM